MTADLVSLRLLLVSEAAAERELIRRAASEASVPVEVVELEAARDPAATCGRLAGEQFDAVFLDSRMPKAGKQAVLDAAHAADYHPLVVLVGAAEMRTREVLTEGLAVDGALAKPIDVAEASALLNACARARRHHRVLIVENSASVRAVMRRVLDSSRFRLETEEAEDTAAAVNKAGDQPFEFVLLDTEMPGIDGFEALAELQRNASDTKVLMIAASNDPGLAERARKAGAADLLKKPFYTKDIDAALTRLFGLMRPRWN